MPRAREFFAPENEKRREISSDLDDGLRVERDDFRSGRTRADTAFAHLPYSVARDPYANTETKTVAQTICHPVAQTFANSKADTRTNAEAHTETNSHPDPKTIANRDTDPAPDS